MYGALTKQGGEAVIFELPSHNPSYYGALAEARRKCYGQIFFYFSDDLELKEIKKRGQWKPTSVAVHDQRPCPYTMNVHCKYTNFFKSNACFCTQAQIMSWFTASSTFTTTAFEMPMTLWPMTYLTIRFIREGQYYGGVCYPSDGPYYGSGETWSALRR